MELKEPTKPWPPYKGAYAAKKDTKNIYKFVESCRDDDWDDDDEEKEAPPEKPIEEVTLGWLLSKLPPGVTPDDVKINFGFYASPFAVEEHHIAFYYDVKVPANKKAYKEAVAKYEKDLAQYEKDKATYDEAVRQKEIAKTEAKLKKLKQGIK